MTSVLLGSLCIGLSTAYIMLMCLIVKHMYETMKQEVKRLSYLFASFVVSYFLRFLYQLLLGMNWFSGPIYIHIVTSFFAR